MPRLTNPLASLVFVFMLLSGALPAAEVRAGLSKALEALLAKDDGELDLGASALQLSKEEFPQADMSAGLKQLDALTEKLTPRLAKAGTATEKLDALKTLLFDEEGFGLPLKDDAAAFLLSEVLRQKRGNCLGLSVLCLALAERTGLPLHGVPVPSRVEGPGHLLVRFDDGAVQRNFDPTERGAAHDDAHYRKLFKLKDGVPALAKASKREVLNLLLVNLGGARVESGKAATALPLLERAVALRLAYAPAHNNLGAARLGLSDLEGAGQAYATAIKLDPDLVAAHTGLAAVALRRGDLEQAETAAMTAEALEPENANAKVVLAGVHLARGNHKAACAALAAAADASPKDARLRCNLGKARLAAGEFDLAEQAYRLAGDLDTGSADAQHGLGECARLTGDAARAKTYFAAALKLDSRHVPTHLTLAGIAQQAKDWKAAVVSFEAVLKDQPYHAEALGGLAEAFIALGRPKDADARVAEALKQQPNNMELALLQADAKLKGGDVAGALALLQGLLPKAPVAARLPIQQRIAVCFGKQGNHRKALETAEDILKTQPKDLPALRVAASASEGLRDAGKATGYYRRVLEVEPRDANARAALERLAR